LRNWSSSIRTRMDTISISTINKTASHRKCIGWMQPLAQLLHCNGHYAGYNTTH
jgi:hypothetical protein